MSEEQTPFWRLFEIDLRKDCKTRDGLTYVQWSKAWAAIKKVHPNITYKVLRFENNLPYVSDKTGIMVFTEVTIDDLTHEMWLPVMNGAKKAMKLEPYTYEVKEWENRKPTGNMVPKTVEAATMFDVNKTIMRCLVKNLAMFGLGLYIYEGEFMPEEDDTEEQNELIALGKSVGVSRKDVLKVYESLGYKATKEKLDQKLKTPKEDKSDKKDS